MTVSSLRSELRESTTALHLQLDSAVGEFGDRPAYAVFVQRTHRFRAAAEQALANDTEAGWQVDAIADLAGQDLVDLGVPALPHAEFPAGQWTRESRLGALYVLEGSSLGARFLMRRAEALGMNADFGARHLAHQSSDNKRWRGFVSELDSVSVDMHQPAVNAALALFRFALSIYSETAHECA